MSTFALSGIMILLYLAIIALAIISYVFQSKGLSRMAVLRGMKAPWLAWVPGANMWLKGKIADHFDDTRRGENKSFAKTYVIVSVIMTVLLSIASVAYTVSTTLAAVSGTAAFEDAVTRYILTYVIIVLVITLPAMIIEYIVYYKIYASAAPHQAVVLLVFSIIFPVIMPFAVYALRERTDGLKISEEPKGDI